MSASLSPKNLEKAFDLLCDCAAKGERCPVTSGPGKHSFLKSAHTGALARQGRIFVEISGRNWRRITILDGPHAGKSTAVNPDPTGRRVYQTVGAEGARVNGRLVDHGANARIQPSAPRSLTARELK